MTFAHDTELALRSAAALVNTDQTGVGGMERLRTTDDLDTFVAQQGWTGSRTHDQEELAAVRALRPVLRRLWQAGPEDAVREVNRLLREAGALPQLVRHDDLGYHIHATPPQAPLASRMAVEAGMALADVIRADQTDRLGVCAAPDCADLLLDLSKNRSRRFCDRGCGNRMDAAAYRARRSGRSGSSRR